MPQAFDVTNQQFAAAVGERTRAEKRSAFDLEPPKAGHQRFPKSFGATALRAFAGPTLADLPPALRRLVATIARTRSAATATQPD